VSTKNYKHSLTFRVRHHTHLQCKAISLRTCMLW